ncbi:MAG: PAS domain-containing protein [Rubrivivax sp.]|nr:PAS domain-containing protein [Rubrivivax sp.]
MKTDPLPLPAELAAALLAATPVALLHAATDGQVTWASPAALALLGPAAAPGRPLADLWAAGADAAALLGASAAAAELPLRQPTPAACWVHAASQPLPQGGVLLALHAVDDKRAAQAEVQRLTELLDLARDFGRLGVWERNVRTMQGRWDPQICHFWGISPDAPTPAFHEATSRLADPDRAELEPFFLRSLQQPGRYAKRYRLRGDDGIWRRIHSQWLVKSGSDGRPERVLGLMMDDSEPFSLAQELSELESQLALAVDLGDIGIWRHDLGNGQLHLNAQALRMLGLPPRPQGFTVDEITDFVHPDDRRRAAASAKEALAGNRPLDLEVRFRRSDGDWRTVMTRRVVQRDDRGRPVAFVGVGLDITARHKAELALRSAVERAALVARGAGLGTWELDMASGEVYWDEQMWRLRGHAPRAQAMDDAERMACVHPEDRTAIEALFRPAIVEGRPYEHQFRVVWPDGQVRWLASRSVELRDEQSGARRRIGVNWDVTDTRTAEAARREREIALRESTAKSKFLARMSHELRTPLNAMLGFSQLLLAEEAGVDEPAATRRRRLEHILSAGEHFLSLINDVLDLASLESGELRIELQPVALAPLVAETLPLLGPLRGRQAVSLRTGRLDLQVLADPTRLRQVLLNLLSNAIKYNHDGGVVTVEAEPRDGHVMLRVSDSGRGMTDEQMRHLFEPFNRLGAEGDTVEGTGIGLAIVKALTESMGGTVQVRSVAGRGSVFELQLQAALCDRGDTGSRHDAAAPDAPLPSPSAPSSRRPDVPAVAPVARRYTLLYVEDNAVNSLIIRELLASRADIQLHLAEDGASGVARAAALQPDLILLDMQLPDCDGFEVMRRLRAQPATASTPCVALSANAMPDHIERALATGMVEYWTKPLDFRTFLAALDALLAKTA